MSLAAKIGISSSPKTQKFKWLNFNLGVHAGVLVINPLSRSSFLSLFGVEGETIQISVIA